MKPRRTIRTQEQVDAFILARPTMPPSDLAHRLALPTPQVRQRMIDLGLDIGPSITAPYPSHPMWGDNWTADDRRMAIWRKQVEGAKARRDALIGDFPGGTPDRACARSLKGGLCASSDDEASSQGQPRRREEQTARESGPPLPPALGALT